jgi:predicted helicase
VAISFLVKKSGARERCRIFYARRPEMETSEEKLALLGTSHLSALPQDELRPDSRNNWLDVGQSDFGDHIPIGLKDTKKSARGSNPRSVFALFSLGISTNRDDWA